MSDTKLKKQRNRLKRLSDDKILAVCILMGMTISRYADTYSIERNEVMGRFYKIINLAGGEGNVEELRKDKFRLIYEIGKLGYFDVYSPKDKDEI